MSKLFFDQPFLSKKKIEAFKDFFAPKKSLGCDIFQKNVC